MAEVEKKQLSLKLELQVGVHAVQSPTPVGSSSACGRFLMIFQVLIF